MRPRFCSPCNGTTVTLRLRIPEMRISRLSVMTMYRTYQARTSMMARTSRNPASAQTTNRAHLTPDAMPFTGLRGQQSADRRGDRRQQPGLVLLYRDDLLFM